MKNSMEVPLKIKKIQLPYDLAIPLLGIYLKNMKTSICKDSISDSQPMTLQLEATSNYDITFSVFRTDVVWAFETKSRLSADIR